MNPEQIIELASAGNLPPVEGIDPTSAQLISSYLCVGDLVAIPVAATSPLWDRSVDCELKTSDGFSFGTLCFTARESCATPENLTSWRYVAFLSDAEFEEAMTRSFTFKYDYVVLDAGFLENYLSEYYEGAPIWGAFSHHLYNPSNWRRSGPELVARAKIKPPTDVHAQNFSRLTAANNNFERFLRLYHSVELLFDYVIFRKIKSLNNDLVGYAEIMKEYSRIELDRLKIIMKEYCKDTDEIAKTLNGALEHKDVAIDIFQTYTKDGNPLSDSNRWSKFWGLVEAEKLSITNLKLEGFGSTEVCRKLVTDVAAYWIYRVRCSIAHNRVGEFMITDDHDEFVGRFASNVLGRAMEQLLSDPDFRQLST